MFKKFTVFNLGVPIIARLSTSTANLKKVASDNVIKKYNKENKLLFGPLLETQAQRKKRLKLEVIPVSSDGITPKRKKQEQNGRSKNSKPKEDFHLNIKLDESEVKKVNHTVQSNEIPVQCDYSTLSLSDILKKDFPLENPAKSQIIGNSPPNSQLTSSNAENFQDSTESYYPSVTSILSSTMSPLARRALDRWRKNKIAALGMEGFLALNKATLQKGKEFHMAIQKLLSDRHEEDLDVPEDIRNCVKSAEVILKQISKVHTLEGEVVHRILQYRGYVDCICDLGKTQNVVIEWKKSESKKSTVEQTYDAPLQLAAYMGAINYDAKYTVQVTSGVVVVVYEDGSPASVFPVVPEHWWHWYRRYQAFHIQETKEAEQ